MRNILFSTALFLSYCISANAQYLHTPVQVEAIKKKSAISYLLDSIAPDQKPIKRPLLKYSYEELKAADQSPVDLENSSLNGRTEKRIIKANELYAAGKFAEAIAQYEKVESFRKNPGIMARIAFCLEQIEEYQKAIDIYNNLMTLDPDNAFLFFQLANCYSQQQDYKMACRQITLAHLFDRNNPLYIDSLTSIYRKINWKFRALDFEPQYEIVRTTDQIKITANATPWIAYASCKALWAYEPGYAENMKHVSNEDSRIIEEKECLLNALVVFEQLDKPDKINFPGLYTLSSALPDKRVNDFIMYEISLRQHPEISSQLSKTRLEQLINYIYTYRVKTLEVSQ